MDVLDAIYQRRAIREFAGQPIHQSTIQTMIDAAIQAPSAMNLQPWSFVVIRDRDRLVWIAREARRHLLETIADDSPLARLREHVAAPDFDMLYGAPALILICATSDSIGVGEDCAMAAENLMLAAHAVGIGTCWIGLARPWLNEQSCKKELGIEAQYRPIAAIVAGYPKRRPAAPGRRQPEIHWIGM